MKKQKRCFQCMELYAEGQICPVCGFDHSKYQSSLDALQPGTILRGRYFVGMRLNQNQIENAYLAWDNLEETAVTIREYYPTELVRRDLTGEQGNKLLVPEGEAGKRYQKGMKGFVREARALVQFSAMPGVLMGKEFFHENNTAYLIQERRKGITLAEYIQENGKMKPEKALRGMKPVLRSLDRLHRAGIFHQNINPDHIIVSENGEMLLTDFGTVRMLEYSGEREPGRFLQRGYAPAEQYQMQEQCDAAADVYAVCAVFYYMMTAEAPEDAEKREEGARLKPFADYGVSLSKERRRVLRKGLAVSKDRRCQTMRELYQALYGFEKNKWFLRLGCGLAVLLLLIVLLGKAVISLEQNKTAETNQVEDVVDSSQQEEKKPSL
ncbi:MAG: protein kinase [Clostridiaceae bacterium]|nr:protein kinase [Clostridiaceae bacterium]